MLLIKLLIKQSYFCAWIPYLLICFLLLRTNWLICSSYSILTNLTHDYDIFHGQEYISKDLYFEEHTGEVVTNGDNPENILNTNPEVLIESRTLDPYLNFFGIDLNSGSSRKGKERETEEEVLVNPFKNYVKITHYIESDFTGDGQDELIYRFIAIGDTGGQPIEPYVSEMQLKVAETMKEFVIINKTSVLLLGDNFYADGVEDIKDDRFKITFENVYLGPLKDINWYVIAGNHDYRGNVTAQMEYRKKSERWKYPDLYYKIGLMIDIKYRDNESLKESIVIDVLMLDTNVLINKGSNGLEEEKYVNEDSQLHHKQWLYNHMSMADFLVVAGHHPIYSFGVAGATKLLQFLNPWLRDNMASLFICGHDHDLQYIEEDTDNITMKYAVFGSGSKLDLQRRIYPYANERKIFRYAEKGGFGLLNFMYPSKRLVVAYYNEDGVFLYRKKIYRRNQQFYQNK
ncbi:unnamed protein product [Gordionus sp. m RMFG-2023]